MKTMSSQKQTWLLERNGNGILHYVPNGFKFTPCDDTQLGFEFVDVC